MRIRSGPATVSATSASQAILPPTSPWPSPDAGADLQGGCNEQLGAAVSRGEAPVAPGDGLTTRQRRLRPVLIVHTGDGKGKTTAACGMALRAWAQGWPVGVYQFVKSATWRAGEVEAFAALGELKGNVTWERMGAGWSWTPKGTAEGAELAQEGWRRVKEGLAAERHRFWLLDEFTYPLDWGWLDLDDVLATLANRPGTQHVVITGRRAPKRLIDKADLVTEMTKIVHPFDRGQRGQAGIEW